MLRFRLLHSRANFIARWPRAEEADARRRTEESRKGGSGGLNQTTSIRPRTSSPRECVLFGPRGSSHELRARGGRDCIPRQSRSPTQPLAQRRTTPHRAGRLFARRRSPPKAGGERFIRVAFGAAAIFASPLRWILMFGKLSGHASTPSKNRSIRASAHRAALHHRSTARCERTVIVASRLAPRSEPSRETACPVGVR